MLRRVVPGQDVVAEIAETRPAERDLRPVGDTQVLASVSNAARLLKLAHMTRNLKGNGLDEGASTRLLVHAASDEQAVEIARLARDFDPGPLEDPRRALGDAGAELGVGQGERGACRRGSSSA